MTAAATRIAVDEWGECVHGMNPAWCGSCKAPLPHRQPAGFTADSNPFEARIDGQCPGCNLPVVAGQRIVHTTRRVYVHAGCVG